MGRHTNKEASMQAMIRRQKPMDASSASDWVKQRATILVANDSTWNEKIIDNVVRKMLFTSMNFMYRCYCRLAVAKRFPRISVVAARMWNTATLTMWQFVCVCLSCLHLLLHDFRWNFISFGFYAQKWWFNDIRKTKMAKKEFCLHAHQMEQKLGS